ncbi:MAG: type II toxin-antitoxin system VapB family antitoxin [Sphingobacteriaceae bacterium]|nr:type II toxin-antitoxin system VapB family antitoxin [Cytophagaceae bacterium]
MQTTVDLDETLVREAMRLSHTATEQEVIERALWELLRKLKKQQLAQLRGRVDWEGDLAAQRTVSNE